MFRAVGVGGSTTMIHIFRPSTTVGGGVLQDALHRVRPLTAIIAGPNVQLRQEGKPPEQRQQSRQGLDNVFIIRVKAPVILSIGVDVVSLCTNPINPCPSLLVPTPLRLSLIHI